MDSQEKRDILYAITTILNKEEWFGQLPTPWRHTLKQDIMAKWVQIRHLWPNLDSFVQNYLDEVFLFISSEGDKTDKMAIWLTFLSRVYLG